MSRIGIDLVEIEEIKEHFNDRFINRVLSHRELEKFNRIKHEEDQYRYLASRFAAKEAYTKLYKPFNEKVTFKDVELLNDETGRPYIVSTYKSDDEIEVSISHSRNYVVAICLLK
jgi:holo-[acyl-carrier protein] synthase